MENASNALLIAAGVLFAMIILSIAVVAYNEWSDYYTSQDSILSQEQLASFNSQYDAYNRDDVTGFELVSLINKIIDYNQRQLSEGYLEMSVKVTFPANAGYTEELFTNGTSYTYNLTTGFGARDELESKISEMKELESSYTAELMTKLVSQYSYIDYSDFGGTRTIRDVLGKNYDLGSLTKSDVLKYSDYLTFKRAEFTCDNTDYENGQIISLEFTQK